MWDYIEERAKKCAEYIVATGCTVRACSAHFSISKSTVHKDVSERLKYIDEDLFERTRKILNLNLSERHIRGGIATQKKYKKEENCKILAKNSLIST
ncbi:MAG: sporulation transcriptional regulator SpoIIID [Clostridia bacterium]|nr:sporulation transcriptional regulator SpoIIID [Clostridia bacterium]